MPFGTLWLPVLLSTVAVFVASSIAWMVLPHHRHDYRKLPNEDAVLDQIRQQGAGPGLYSVPGCGKGDDRNAPELQEKMKRGPIVFVAVQPGFTGMGRHLGLWTLFLFVVSVFTGYVARHALPAGADFVAVMRVTTTTAACAYLLGPMPNAIWNGHPWSAVSKWMADGFVYALITGALFAWLWPGA